MKAPPAQAQRFAEPATPAQVVYPEGEDAEWEIPWGKVFQKLKAGDLEERAGQYAEALMDLRVQEDDCDAEMGTITDACDQLFQTAYREALLAHLKALVAEVSEGVPSVIVEAARQAAADPTPTLQVGSAFAKSAKLAQHLQPPQGILPKSSASGNSWGVQSIPHPMGTGNVILPPASMLAGGNQPDGNLYVAGLPENITQAQFTQLFSKFGNILSAKCIPDRQFGFVKFSSLAEAQAAIDKLDGFEHNGLNLVVRMAAQDSGGSGMPGLPGMQPGTQPGMIRPPGIAGMSLGAPGAQLGRPMATGMPKAQFHQFQQF